MLMNFVLSTILSGYLVMLSSRGKKCKNAFFGKTVFNQIFKPDYCVDAQNVEIVKETEFLRCF